MNIKYKTISGLFLLFFSFFVVANEIDPQELLCHASISNCHISSYSTLDKGLGSSKLFHVITKDDHQYVLRLFDAERKTKLNKREIDTMRLAAKVQIAPKVYWSDVNIGLLMDYIHDQGLSIEQYKSPDFYRQAAQMLKKLHDLKEFADKKKSPFQSIEQMQADIRQMLDDKTQSLKKIEQLVQHLEQIKFHYEPHITEVASHNDLHPFNLLFDGQNLWLIDWESASISDPMVDVASFSMFFIFRPEMEQVFLRHYKQNWNQIDQSKYTVMLTFTKGKYALALLRACLRHYPGTTAAQIAGYLQKKDVAPLKEYLKAGIELGTQEKQMTFCLVLLNEFLSDIKSPEFQTAIQVLDGL